MFHVSVHRNGSRSNKHLASYALITPDMYTDTYRDPHASIRRCFPSFNEHKTYQQILLTEICGDPQITVRYFCPILTKHQNV